MARRPPVHGVDVRLTIRRQDQTRAMAALDGCTGAFVVLDADTGAVIAAASAPSYEADRYAEVLAEQKAFFEEHRYWRRHHPLKDAAFRDFHVPGSVMKPFTAIASLTAGVSTPETRVVCEHYFRNRRGDLIRGALKCDDTHGELDLHHALVRSCNIYFQTLVKQIMEKELFPHFAATGGRFGFGKPTGAEIEPAPFQDTFKFGSSWAEYVLCAIGQSDIELSTAQIARAYAGLATGSLPRVHLVAEVGGERRRPETERLGIPASVLQPIRAALVEVPRTGTARGYHLERWNVACKTGTAQRVMRERPRPRRSYNGWLAGWVPAQNGRPRIAFAMVVLDTHLHGAQACGPRVAEFLAGFFGEGRG